MKKKLLIALNILALLIIIKGLLISVFSRASSAFDFTAFDIGQGDALIFTVPETSIQILIDTGPGEKILAKLKGYLPPGDDLIDIIIITHCHSDHIGGLPEILSNYRIGIIVDPGAQCDSSSYQIIKDQIEILKIPVLYAIRGEKIRIGQDFKIEILHPFLSKDVIYKNENDTSVVSLVSWKDNKIILTGDLEKEGEEELLSFLESKGELDKIKSDILKVGHHGSKTSTSVELLEYINPQRAVISCGKENKFGHPHQETILKLQERGIEIFRTDQDGDIKIGF